MADQSNTERVHWIVSGEVQGVGFRHRAMQAAGCLGLTGWVRNLHDGRVELEVQGAPDKIRLLLPSVEQGLYIEIEHVFSEKIEIQPGESSFGVRY